MTFITGDIHADIDIRKLNTENFPKQKELTKDDFLIICGDFGLVWDESDREMYWRNWLSNRNFTTLFVDGNHENFNLLRQFPIKEKFGGYVREIAPTVYHLERGQVFNVDGQRIFAMGGARSIDAYLRTEGRSWWPEEIPSKEEMDYAIASLDKANWDVDYVITHCAPKSVQAEVLKYCDPDPVAGFLERIYSELKFKRWYFGHYHIDKQVNKQFVALFDKIVEI